MTLSDELAIAIKSNIFFKIACLVTVFPALCITVGVDRLLLQKGIRNPLMFGIPRDTAELRRHKQDFFKVLQRRAVKDLSAKDARGVRVREPLIPSNAIMVYVDVKDGTSAEPEKNNGVACVDVAFRIPGAAPCSKKAAAGLRSPSDVTETTNDTVVREAVDNFVRYTTTTTLEDGTEAEITVLRLFIKMSTARLWPIPFKAVIATFSSSVKEVEVFTRFIPMVQDYCSGRAGFKNYLWGTNDQAKKSSAAALAPLPAPIGGLAPPTYPRYDNCPVSVPVCHLATWNRLFDRSFSVLDCIDTSVWRPIADYQTVTEPHLVALVRSIASLHAVTVGRVGYFASRYNKDMLTMSENDIKIHDAVCQWSNERHAVTWLQSILDAFKHNFDDAEAAKKYKTIQQQLKKDPTLAVKWGLADINKSADLTEEQFDALNDGTYFRRVWNGIAKRLEKEPTCISHCDCRPGNKLFCGGGGGLNPSPSRLPPSHVNDSHPKNCDTSDANFVMSLPDEDDANAQKYAKNVATVVQLDWEACAMAPLLFDISYIISGRTERRRYETVLLKEYLAALRDGVESRLDRDGVTDPAKRERVLSLCVPTFEYATRMLKIMYLTHCYFAWALEQFGGIGIKQGNSHEDSTAWKVRGTNMWISITSDPDAMADDIGNGVSGNDIRMFRYAMGLKALKDIEAGIESSAMFQP